MAETSVVTASRFTRKTEPPTGMSKVCLTWCFTKKGEKTYAFSHFYWTPYSVRRQDDSWPGGHYWSPSVMGQGSIAESGCQVGDKLHEGEDGERVLEDITFSP